MGRKTTSIETPAIPDDAIIVSYSELDTFRQCPLKHFLAYKMRYTKPQRQGTALTRGSLFHAVMEAHYKAIMAEQMLHRYQRIPLTRETDLLAEIWENKIKPILIQNEEPISEDHELVEWMYKGYVQHYGIDRHWKIVAVEHQVLVPLRDENGERSRYVLKAKIDLIVMDRNTGKHWVVDHKSCANLPTYMDLDIDDQFGLYQWSLREVGYPVIGSMHSATRTTRNTGDWPDADPKYKPQPLDKRMSRTALNRSDKELTNLALDAYWAAFAAHPPEGQQPARYSSPDPRQCGWKCDFKEPHLVMRRGRKVGQVMHEYGFRIDRTRH